MSFWVESWTFWPKWIKLFQNIMFSKNILAIVFFIYTSSSIHLFKTGSGIWICRLGSACMYSLEKIVTIILHKRISYSECPLLQYIVKDSNADIGVIFWFLQNSPITKAVCTKISIFFFCIFGKILIFLTENKEVQFWYFEYSS